jgi:ABC-type bacteriocin/lantibiotic exporter with double-glycine peptidase domain
MDLTWVIIVVVAIMVVLVAVWFFKFKKPQLSKYEEETEDLEGFE